MTESTHINEAPSVSDDYTRALTTAHIAFYDSLKSAPRITRIEPTTTAEYIENLASTIYTQAQQAGGSIPYTVIREVSENFIHAQFREIVVSILDHGNTIRFSDQGPGIPDHDKAQLPGFSSATAPMKQYIRGVGSGLPLVKEFLSISHGRITIEDNLRSGAVVTISMEDEPSKVGSVRQKGPDPAVSALNDTEKAILQLLASDGPMRLTDITNILEISPSTAHRLLGKLNESGLVEKDGKQHMLSDVGERAVNSF